LRLIYNKRDMLINFSIQNFGAIKDRQTLSFEADRAKHLEDYYVINVNNLRLLKLGLIYGANASGKTTILKALDFLRSLIISPKILKTETFDFEPFLFDEKTRTQNTVFEIDFIHNDIRYFYEVQLNKKAIIKEELYVYNPNKTNVFKRTTDLDYELTSISFVNKRNLGKLEKKSLEMNTLWNNTVLGGFSKTNLEIKELKEVTDWFNNYLTMLITPKTNILSFFEKNNQMDLLSNKDVVEILKKADFNIAGISKTKIQFALLYTKTNPLLKIDNFINIEHVVNNQHYEIQYSHESQGTQRYYGLAVILYLLITKSVSFTIDELESSLHPELFIHFLLSFLSNAKKSQLIATAHNRELLNNKDIFRNDAIWITDKNNESCATELYSLADFNTNVIRDTTNIFNAYKIGKLGGVPNLGDYYIEIENHEES